MQEPRAEQRRGAAVGDAGGDAEGCLDEDWYAVKVDAGRRGRRSAQTMALDPLTDTMVHLRSSRKRAGSGPMGMPSVTIPDGSPVATSSVGTYFV
jgi:hypothetical protein